MIDQPQQRTLNLIFGLLILDISTGYLGLRRKNIFLVEHSRRVVDRGVNESFISGRRL